MQLNKLH